MIGMGISCLFPSLYYQKSPEGFLKLFLKFPSSSHSRFHVSLKDKISSELLANIRASNAWPSNSQIVDIVPDGIESQMQTGGELEGQFLVEHNFKIILETGSYHPVVVSVLENEKGVVLLSIKSAEGL